MILRVFQFILGVALLDIHGHQVLADHYRTEATFNSTNSDEFHVFCEFPVWPVGLYPLNREHSVNGISANRGTGKAVGTDWAPGIHGDEDGSLLLHGNAGSYVQLDRGRLDTRNSLTILAFIFPHGSDGPIVNYKVDGYGVQLWETTKLGAGTLMARFNRRDLTYAAFVSKQTLNLSQWNYVGASYNYDTGEASLWHEANKVASQYIGSTQIATQFDVRLGALAMSSLKKYYKGRIACLQFYPEALSPEMIRRAREACKPFAPVSTVTLHVNHDHQYIEVGDNITFEATTDNGARFSTYTFNPGDGSPGTVLSENVFTHTYSAFGNFSAGVLIFSRCRNRSLHVDVTVTVEKPVELLEGLEISCNDTKFPELTRLALRSDRGTDFDCVWDFGDGQTSRTSHATGAQRQIALHAYSVTGEYTVRANCSNRLSVAAGSVKAVVQSPITGLTVSPLAPQRYKEAFKVMWQVRTGSDITYSASFGGKALHVIKHDQNLSAEAWVLAADNVMLGLQEVTVTASNDVTPPIVTSVRVLVERLMVAFVPRLVHSNRDIEVGEEFSLDMTEVNHDNGADPTYLVDFGDGKAAVRTKERMIKYSYPTPGDYRIFINASNHVSEPLTATLMVRIHKAVVLLKGLRVDAKTTKYPDPTRVTLNLDQGSDFMCIANYSDGQVDRLDYRGRYLFDPVRNPSRIGLRNIRLEFQHSFVKDGAHLLHLSCSNRLSEVAAALYLIVQVPVRSLAITSPPAQVYGQAVNISLQIASGTNASYEVTFNGQRFTQRMNGLFASLLIGQDVYKNAGVHRFEVRVWNLVTSPISTTGSVSLEYAIVGLRAEFVHDSGELEVNETVMFNASVEAGTEPEYVFDFGDGSGLVVLKSGVAHAWHKFNPHGDRTVRVTARNKVSRQKKELRVTVLKPVIKLVGLSIAAKPTKWGDATEIVLSFAEGSDFRCSWEFADGQTQDYGYEHLNFYEDGKDVDEAPFTDLSFNIHHTYEQVGVYRPAVVCSNRLSSIKAHGNVVVQKPISGFELEDVSPQPTKTSFTVHWKISSGTNASYEVDFAHGSVTSLTSLPEGGHATVTSSSPGVKLFRVTARNLVTLQQVRSKPIVLQVPLANLSLSVSYDSRDLEVGQFALFEARLTQGSDPSYVMDFGDGTEISQPTGSASHRYSFHASYADGNPFHVYNARVFASNNVSYANASVLVKVHKPVIRLQKMIVLSHPVNVSDPTKITVRLDQGSDVTCTYYFDDGFSLAVDFQDTVFLGADKTPRNLFQNLSLETDHTYRQEGDFKVTVVCGNRLGKVEAEISVAVQAPVSGMAIQDVPTVLHGESFEVQWVIQSGTDVSYEVFVANTSVLVSGITASGGKALVPSHAYVTDGFHVITITASNLVSTLSRKTQVTIQIPVVTAALVVTYPDPISGRVLGGHGLLGDHFPALWNLSFNAEVDGGTHLVYHWNVTWTAPVSSSNESNITNVSSPRYDSEQLVTREPVLRYKFQEMGKFLVSVKASNDLSQATTGVNLTVLFPVDGLQLRTNSPQMTGRVIQFNFTATSFGFESCLVFDTGANVTYRQGFARCDREFGQENFTLLNKPPKVLHFEHIYRAIHQYPVTLNISNQVSFISFEATVEVTLSPCSDPVVILKNVGSSPADATRVYRSTVFTVRTAVTVDCTRTKKVRYNWQLFVNDSADQFLSNQTSAGDVDISLKSRELFLPKRSLPYALYRVIFTAAMDAKEKFETSAVGYVEIVPSPLVAKISGGNLIRRGFGKKVEVDGSKSQDPDILHGDPGLSYLWLCRSTKIDFPENLLPGIELPSTPYDTSDVTSMDKNSSHHRGCYGDGNFTLPGSHATVSVNSTRMRENETYVIMLVLSKGDRRAFAYQVLEVVQGDPPVIAIECKQNCAAKMNPSSRLSVLAKCSEGCFGELIYSWEVYQNEGGKKSKLWQRRDNITATNSVQNPNGPAFALPRDILDGDEEYLIRVFGGRENGAKGRSEYTSLTNDPPRGGACSGKPPVGEALVSDFVLSCSGWRDADMPLTYEFNHKNEEGKLVLLSFGENSHVTVKLPLGNPQQNFSLEIHVKILDYYKGESSVVFTVQSREPEMDANQLGDTLSGMTSGEDSPLGSLLGVGDFQAVFQMAGAVNSLMNAQSAPDSAAAGALNETEEQRNNTAKKKAVRDALVAAAASAPVTSLEDLRQSAGVLASSTAKKDETSNSAKNASAKAFQNMASVLQKSSGDSAGYDAVVGGAETLLTGMGQVLNAASSSVKLKPGAPTNGTNRTATPTCTPFDFECKKKLEARLTTTLPPTTSPEGDDDDEDDDDDDGGEELDDDAKGNRDVANNILGMLASVGGSVVDNKLPGEKATVLATGGMEMTVERADPASLGGSAIGEGPASFKMPASGDLFKNANSSNMGDVDKQMTAMNDNPFTWDKSAAAVSGQVVSLSFSSGGGKLGVSGLDEPMDIFVPRDTAVGTPEKFEYNPNRQRGWSFHRLVIDKKGTAANVEVQNSAPFQLYVRREKPPRISDYDWMSSSDQPNNTRRNESTSPNCSSVAISIMKEYAESRSANSRFGWLPLSVGGLPLGLTSAGVKKFAKLSNCSSQSLDFSASLFMSDKQLRKGLYFIGIKYAGDLETGNNTEADFNVTYTLRVYKSKCMYWNETKQKWKSNGCEVGNLTNLKRTHCRCNHLTSFGSALNVAPNPIDFSAVAAGFSNMFASGNVVVFFTIVGLFVLYPLLITWARRADRRDLELFGATPLPSNFARAKYHYEITFFTGKRGGAGTTAQVSCQLYGANGDSGPCVLKDDERSVFQKRGVNSFIISMAHPLGEINKLCVWHDNHGLSPSWFLKKAVLSDCQTGRIWLFLGECWFAVDEDDFQIMRELEPATDEDKTQFKVLFKDKIDDGLSNAHLWFSVLYKTPRSRFTRVQRITCCLNLLCTGMVASAMFFGQVPEGGDPDAINIGPIQLSLRCIMIGIQSSLVVIPVNVAVMFLFQNSKRKDPPPRKQQSSEETEDKFESIAAVEVTCTGTDIDSSSDSEVDEQSELKAAQGEITGTSLMEKGQYDEHQAEDEKEQEEKVLVENIVCDIYDDSKSDKEGSPDSPPTKRKRWPFREKRSREGDYVESKAEKDRQSIDSPVADDSPETNVKSRQGCCSCFGPKDPEEEKRKAAERKRKAAEKRRRNKDGSLPHWCLHMAYVLCFLASVTSALFTLFYSMMWGKEKSNAWLVAFVFSFFQDTFINQPLKVFVVSLLVALIIKKPDEDEDLEFAGDPEKGLDEEWMHADAGNEDGGIARQQQLIMYQPPSEEQLAAARERKLQEKDLFDKIKKLVYYVSVLMVLLVVSKGARDEKSYSLRRSLEDGVVEPLSRTRKLYHVVNSDYFWDWAENTLVPGLFEHEWYNGGEVINRTGFVEDRYNMRMGVVRFRQVRVTNGSCKVNAKFKDEIDECNAVYSKEKEDKRSFKPAWKDGEEDPTSKQKKTASPWEHFTGKEANQSSPVWGRLATYAGGGYIAELGDSAAYAKGFINYLKSTNWIDARTRAVFVEGSVYNPNVNLLAVLKVSVEFTAAGTAVPFYNINIMKLYRSLSRGYSMVIVCEFIYVLILLQLLYSISKGTYKERKAYYRRVLSWMDIVFFLNGLVVLSLYFIRARFISQAVETLAKDQVSYVGFADLASYVELLVYLLALADFIAILKFLHFMSFTRSVKLLSETIFQCFVQMQSFSVMFFVVVMAYVLLAYTVFGAYLEGYMDIPSTIGSIFSLLMGVFEISEFELQPDFKMLGRFFFSSFTSIMIFLYMNFFITIINSVYHGVQTDERLAAGESDLFGTIFKKFMAASGIQPPPKRPEPVVENPTDAELQWDLHVQYITTNQMKRLKQSIRSVQADDETWDLYLTKTLEQYVESSHEGDQQQQQLILGNTDALPGKSDATIGGDRGAPDGIHETLDTSSRKSARFQEDGGCDDGDCPRRDASLVEPDSDQSAHEELAIVEPEQDSLPEPPQIRRLRDLISQKEAELGAAVDDNERARQEKIIGCLRDLLTTSLRQVEEQKEAQGRGLADESSA